MKETKTLDAISKLAITAYGIMSGELRSGWILSAALIPLVVAFAIAGIQIYWPVEVVINSIPSGAKISIDGVEREVTPATLKLRPSQYRLGLERSGFSDTEKIVNISSQNRSIELTMLPLETGGSLSGLESRIAALQARMARFEQQAVTPLAADNESAKNFREELGKTQEELAILRKSLLTNPEQIISLPLLEGKIRLLEKEVEGIRGELIRAHEFSKWSFATQVGILGGLLAIIVTLILAKKGEATGSPDRGS